MLLPNPPSPIARGVILRWFSAAVYTALIVYGSLYPFVWRPPVEPLFSFLTLPWPRYLTRTDIATNVAAYLPLGFLLAGVLRARFSAVFAVLGAVLGGVFLSFGMETLQMFVPGRISSLADVATNGSGALLGGVLFLVLRPETRLTHFVTEWRRRLFRSGTWVDAGLWLLGLWALSQLSLELPSLIAGNLKAGFTPFWKTLSNPALFRPQQSMVFMLEITSLGLFTATLIKPGLRTGPLLFWLLTTVVALKFLAAAVLLKFSVLARLLSLEVLSGFALGWLTLAATLVGRRHRPHFMAVAFLASFAAAKQISALANASSTGNLVVGLGPVTERMFNITGLAFLVSEIWPLLAVIHVVVQRFAARSSRVL